MKRALIAILIVLCSGTMGAREIRVGSVKAFRRAVEMVAPGDTILLRKGIYRLKESLVIEGKSDLAIIGKNAVISGGVSIPKWRLHKAGGLVKVQKCLI